MRFLCSSSLRPARSLSGVLVAGALLWAPTWSHAQEATAPVGQAQAPTAQEEGAFWHDQDVLTSEQRASYERNMELLRLFPHPDRDAAFEKLRAQPVPGTGRSAGELELLDPTKAAAFYGAFLSQNQNKSDDGVELRVRVSSLAAQLFATSLNQPRKALAVYDWSLALLQGTSNPVWMRLAVERDHLIRQQRGEEATTKQVQLGAVAVPATPNTVTVPSMVVPSTAPGATTAPAVSGSVAVPSAVTLGGAPSAPAKMATTASPVASVMIAPLAAPVVTASSPVTALPSSVQVGALPEAPTASHATPTVAAVVPTLAAPNQATVSAQPNAVAVQAPSALPQAAKPRGGVTPVNPFIELAPSPSVQVPDSVALGTLQNTEKSVVVATPQSVSVIAAPLGQAQHASPVVALPASLDASTARRDVALAQIKAGTLSGEEAWASGTLNYDNICDFFQNQTGDWIVAERAKDNGLRYTLISLLLAHEEDRFKDLTKVPQKVRLWLADYYQSKKDARCVEVAETILETSRRPVASNDQGSPTTFQAIERMAWFYQATYQHQKCAETWLKVVDYYPQTRWMLGDAYLLGARAFDSEGKNVEAQQLRAKVPSLNDKLLTAWAAYDQAITLTESSKYQEAVNVLKPLVKNDKLDEADALISEGVAIAYFRAGDWKQAAQYSNAVLEASDSVTSSNDTLGVLANRSQARLTLSNQWLKNPITTDVGEVHFSLTPGGDTTPLVKHLFVRSPKDIPLQVSVDDPSIKVSLSGVKQPNDYFFQQEVVVEVPANLEKSVQAQITITSPAATQPLKVPVIVTVEDAIQPSVPSIFFGMVTLGQPTSRSVVLSSTLPFRVLKVESDDPNVKPKVSGQDAKEQTVEVTITPMQSNQFIAGTLRITTNLRSQEVIEVPYAAHTQ